MPSGKTVKFVLYEVLQFAALIVPVFVIMERFAGLIRDVKGRDLTAYWLVVAASIAYVTSVTLLVWVPLKYLILKRRRFITEITQWRPTALAYLILCTLPCFAILIASSKVQVDRGRRLDHFAELPVSLVLFSLICVDIIERIRPCSLIGQSDSLDADLDMPGPILTHLEQVTTISGQLHPDESQNGLTPGHPEARNGSASGRWRDFAGSPSRSTPSSRATSTAYLYSSSPRPWSHPRHLGFLWRRDVRSEVFVDSFMFWLDTVELVRVAGEPSIFYSVWVFPVYILGFLSTFRMVITPQNPLLSSAGFVLQDLPFFIIRVALIVVFGYVTPLLYPLKNVLVSLTFIYFTFLTKLRIFKRQSMF
ncbi:transmembrane protein 236-like [Seriola lalandi dorsalis]|uniref:Transmembrane protein 236 n=1 Tax=Seriola lalandi dorsalis TaxID=1841481 RepID=A0A3B4X515_SERLL|nr:transmembrane protein 236-like [Seriola lalandi dorsalis]XP_056248144.1 transmembrane protein 236 [Seriola aureovittata]